MQKSLGEQIEDLQRAIQAQESLRPMLDEDVVDAALAVLRQKLMELERRQVDEKNREQRKMLTVMYADISGFTALSETMEAEDVAELMQLLWGRIDLIIQAYGGHIDKHIGDNVVALWGVLTSREDDAEQAVRAALKIQQELPGLSIEHPLQMHIAIHSGQVMLGEVGVTREYTAVGRAIQVAAMLESEARPGEVVISQDTLRLVRGLFDVEARSEIPISGYERPLSIYRVLRPRPYAFRPHTRGVEGVETRMIGRDAELALLQEALRDVLFDKKARAVTVVGEAGIGKSRLLYEFENWLAPRARQLWLMKGRAIERTATVPYTLLRDVVALGLSIPDDVSLDFARQRIERAIRSLLPGDPAALEKAHFIGHMLGLDFSASPELSGILSDPGQIHDRARYYLMQVIAAVAGRQPVVLLLEDLHWADEASLNLLIYLMNEIRDLPVLLVALTRPSLTERLPDWWERLPGQQRLNLNPLDEAASRRLVREILQKAPSIPPALDELVISGAEGNPFYVEEIIKMLIEDGVIASGEIWKVNESQLGQMRVPPTLTGILQARLDGLPEVERVVLQAASVLGRAFWDGALVSLTSFNPDTVNAALDSLEAREFIFPRQNSTFSGQAEYVFKHALLRQVVYENILKRQRRRYHLLAAEWLIAQNRERVSGYAALVAGHFEQAEDAYRAALWFGQAGKQAYETYASAAAVEYNQKALQYARQSPVPPAERLDWQETLGKALFALARYEEALNSYQEMRAIADNAASVDGWARAWYSIAYVHDHLGNNSLSLESAENALRLADKGAQPELLIRAVYGKGWALYRLGDANSAIHLGELALRLAHNLENPVTSQREMAQACQLLGAAHELHGELDRAQEYEQRALVLFRQLRDRRGEAAMLNNQGVGAFIRGDYKSAVAYYEQALRIAREIGSQDRIAMFLSNLGGARAGSGEFAAAEADIRSSIESVGGRMTHFLPLTYVFWAEALLGQEKYEQACETAQTGLRLAQESNQPDVISSAYRALGNCAAMRLMRGIPSSDELRPEAFYRESIRIAEEIGSEVDKARTLRDWACADSARGNSEQVAARRAEALSLFKKLGMDFEVQRMEQS